MRMILLFLLYYTDKSNNKEVILKLYHLKPKNKPLALIFNLIIFFLRIDIETPDPLSRVKVCQGYRSSNPYPYPLYPTLQPQGFGQPLTITKNKHCTRPGHKASKWCKKNANRFKKCKKDSKEQPNNPKLADLVCTKGFFLYKCAQVSTSNNKCAIRLFGVLFVVTCYCLDAWQIWSNATKWAQKKMTFADADWWGVPVP